VFKLRSTGSFARTESYLRALLRLDLGKVLREGGELGVRALSAASPRDTGLSANSWTYRIEEAANSVSVIWSNTDVENGFPVALMLQYGYSTGTGGYVAGRDYINPAMKPVFDQIEANVRRAVTSLK
jgi:hypothetical protein